MKKERERPFDDEDVLRVTQLVKTTAVKGVSFGVKKNEVFTILGASGAGKSTTLKCLVNIEQSSGGKVYPELKSFN